MNRFTLFVITFSFIMLNGCNNNDIDDRIYNTFKNTDFIVIIKLNPPEVYQSIIKGKDLNEIKKEIKKIGDIKYYVADAVPFGEFKQGFKLIFLVTNKSVNKKIRILSSIDQCAMIIRKKDIFPAQKSTLPKIEVYEFAVSPKVISILKKYEEALPNEGFFIVLGQLIDY